MVSPAITCCPRCRKPVEARNFMNAGMVGMFDSVLPGMDCVCGYSGLPIQVSAEGYAAWIKKSTKKG